MATAVDSGDQPALRAVEVVGPRGSEVLDDSPADEVNLEEAGRHSNGERVRPAGERRGDVREYLLLVGGLFVELRRRCRVADE